MTEDHHPAPTPSGLFAHLSLDTLRRWDRYYTDDDSRCRLARRLLRALDEHGEAAAEAEFLDIMRRYFFNLGHQARRQHADAIAVAFGDATTDPSALWKYLREKGVVP